MVGVPILSYNTLKVVPLSLPANGFGNVRGTEIQPSHSHSSPKREARLEATRAIFTIEKVYSYAYCQQLVVKIRIYNISNVNRLRPNSEDPLLGQELWTVSLIISSVGECAATLSLTFCDSIARFRVRQRHSKRQVSRS
jgi:hypothetical protein